MNTLKESDINKLLAEYLDLKEEIKVKSIRLREILTWCKTQGTFSTSQYVCAVKLQTRMGIAGLNIVIEALGRSILEEHDLIRVSEFELVTISPKLGAMYDL